MLTPKWGNLVKNKCSLKLQGGGHFQRKGRMTMCAKLNHVPHILENVLHPGGGGLYLIIKHRRTNIIMNLDIRRLWGHRRGNVLLTYILRVEILCILTYSPRILFTLYVKV